MQQPRLRRKDIKGSSTSLLYCITNTKAVRKDGFRVSNQTE